MENNIKSLTKACDELGFSYEFIDLDNNFVRVKMDNGWQYFELNKTPFNTEAAFCICKDKSHSYQLLKDVVRVPKTLDFLDFNVSSKYSKYKHCNSIAAALARIDDNFTYPIVVKQNKGALGTNVFLCSDALETEKAFQDIFNHQSKSYDYIALAQEFVTTKSEYRLLCAYGKPIFAYQRGSAAATFNVKYWEHGEQAQLVTDKALFQQLADFVQPIYDEFPMGWVGYDIIIDDKDELYLIELNASPQFNNFIEHNSSEPVIELYKHALTQLNKRG
ncbi:ATP-grasp domain-containing protein [Pseudoalteromonas sp. S16_S37]|uniref:ATP-grasp domain-containing protein n=1 Tax=Pseudoalteromonas sp. S16_S37 TaxID=2720228 RepID=UPI001680D993|nr:ATP-grasp domain-containing protein [Pseudoalteromonas sp. S16_S37]MBD1584329.1 ATP-grasp domain-containing protein [Pseudoalteromonas sp. S16_S37]